MSLGQLKESFGWMQHFSLGSQSTWGIRIKVIKAALIKIISWCWVVQNNVCVCDRFPCERMKQLPHTGLIAHAELKGTEKLLVQKPLNNLDLIIFAVVCRNKLADTPPTPPPSLSLPPPNDTNGFPSWNLTEGKVGGWWWWWWGRMMRFPSLISLAVC